MNLARKILVAIVALEHVYILVLEMFLWTSPRALKAFDMTMEVAEVSKSLAANQGLYNGFLAAGLFWSLLHPNKEIGHQISIFFLLCVLTAAIYGGITVKPSILVIQGVPAMLALASVFLWKRQTMNSNE